MSRQDHVQYETGCVKFTLSAYGFYLDGQSIYIYIIINYGFRYV
jgi:hypothetical protein